MICFLFSPFCYSAFSSFGIRLCHHHSATLLGSLSSSCAHDTGFRPIFEFVPVLYTSSLVQNISFPPKRVSPRPYTSESRRPPVAHPLQIAPALLGSSLV